MTTQFLNYFFNLHSLIILSFLMSITLHFFSKRGFLSMSASTELRFNHVLIFLVFVLPIVALQMSDRFYFKPVAKTYSAIKMKDYAKVKKQNEVVPDQIVLTNNQDPLTLSVNQLKNIVLILLICSMIYSIYQVYLDYRKLYRLTKNTYLYKKYRSVRIVFSDEVRVPFSFRSLTKAWVVLPMKFSSDHNLLKVSIFHELQHHRQKDTLSVYLFQFMKAVAGINPALHHWFKLIFEIQEFKVDETLIDQGKVKRQEYARCLIEVAESVSQIEKPLVCATGLAFLPQRQELTRRIEFMYKNIKTSRFAIALMALLITTSMTALAFTTNKAIDSRSLSMADAEKMAKHARTNSRFPITVNDFVLEWLNYYLGTIQGRGHMRQSLLRMEAYRPMIEKKLLEYNAPIELMAIPIVESGYQNLLPSANPVSGAAGLWQFIAPTARFFGLKVNKHIDERMDIPKETDVAIRYLMANKMVFNSWELAIMAYNSGEKRVRDGIEKTGSDDAWELVKKGYENDTNYLAKVIAAILIMKNPSSLN